MASARDSGGLLIGVLLAVAATLVSRVLLGDVPDDSPARQTVQGVRDMAEEQQQGQAEEQQQTPETVRQTNEALEQIQTGADTHASETVQQDLETGGGTVSTVGEDVRGGGNPDVVEAVEPETTDTTEGDDAPDEDDDDDDRPDLLDLDLGGSYGGSTPDSAGSGGRVYGGRVV